MGAAEILRTPERLSHTLGYVEPSGRIHLRSPPMSDTPRLQVRYANRRALLSSVRTERSVLMLFVPVTERVAAGSSVLLEISLDALRFELEARVRLQGFETGARAAGLTVVFPGELRKAAVQMLTACAAMSSGDDTGIEARHEVDVRCSIDLHGRRLAGALRDLSATGAFVGTPLVPGLRGEAEIVLRLEPLFGRWGGRVIKARVIWVGEKKGVQGFGARFLDENASVRTRLKKHLPSI